MKGCEEPCPLEASTQDERSHGPVHNDELIVRAGYDPLHFNSKTGAVKVALLRQDDLYNGTLSVWRVSETAHLDMNSAVEICRGNTPDANTFKELRGTSASVIRSAQRAGIEGRLFCIVDETDVDDLGGHHPSHAHIRICQGLMANISSKEDPNFQTLREHLFFLFKTPSAKLYPAELAA